MNPFDYIKGKVPIGKGRSPRWAAVRAEHLKHHPRCEVCGGAEKIEVYHIKPFVMFPWFELDPSNLITLCESGGSVVCHRFFGHLGNYKRFNPGVCADAATWKKKLVIST